MKRRLVLGLGGSLAGDDAVGLELARRLAMDPRLPPDVEALEGGADLLRLGALLGDRSHIVLVDALEAGPGETEPLVGDHPIPGLDSRQTHAHHLSAIQALDLLRLTEPALAGVRVTWFLVPVGGASAGDALSPALTMRLPALVDDLLRLL